MPRRNDDPDLHVSWDIGKMRSSWSDYSSPLAPIPLSMKFYYNVFSTNQSRQKNNVEDMRY